LTAFRSKIQSRKHVKYWASPDDLAGKVALTFGQFIKSYPALGWVHADQQASSETLAEINELRKRVAEMQLALDEARTSPPAGTEVLSQGEDEFEVWMPYAVTYSIPGYGSDSVNEAIRISASWDEVFSTIGPLMLDESPEGALESQIHGWLQLKHQEDVKTHLMDAIGFERDPSDLRLFRYKANIPSTDFHTILVQLMALGLITQSERRRSVADKGTYWTLTPYGRTRLIQLRAIRKATAGGRNPLSEPAQ
jgi:hypothetical protein